jgi:stress-induced-phosphoprotein 1
MGGMGGAGLGGMFGPEGEAKLKANPRIAKYFEDPQFQSKWAMCQQNPQMMMQLLQSDPRLMDVFKELTGVDLLQMNEDKQRQASNEDDLRKTAKAAAEVKKAADEQKRKEAEEAALPDEERQAVELKKQAEAAKAEGTVFYKARNFEKALEFYGKAIELLPSDLTYHSNKAAVYFEMKNYDACLQACDDAVEASRTGGYDYAKLAKVLARKGNALLQQKKYDESIEMYNKALVENNDHSIKMALQKAQKTKKDEEAKAYINPEIAEEHRLKGNDLFKDGNYPAAIKEYEEGLKRNPTSTAIFSNRCATYIKLMEPTTALKDAEKCLELDPKFVKAYARKGTCHHLMKEYHKAMKAFEDGLKIDPASKDCTDGKNRTLMTI